MPKLTLEEMAAELKVCPRTMKKYTSEYGIPHGGLGRDLRFDADEVWAHLKSLKAAEQPTDRVDLKPEKSKKKRSNRPAEFVEFYQDLGLEVSH
jgi:hypothetical protein